MADQMVKDLLFWWKKSNPEFHKTIIDSDSGKTLLHLASDFGYVGIVKELIAMGADPNVQDNRSQTPLHGSSNTLIVRALLENGANVNAMDTDKFTPLHAACDEGDIEVAKLLLENGANVELLNQDEESPLYVALYGENEKVSKLLFDKVPELVNKIVKPCSGSYPIHLVSEQGNEEMLKMLLEKGANCSVKDKFGMEPIHHAAKKGHLNIVKLLIQRNRNLTKSINKARQTALHLSVKFKDIEIVKELLKSGAQINVQDMHKITPLIHACQLGFCKIAKLLIENNASLNMQDVNGNTALHWAVIKNKTDIVQMLLDDKRCILNMKDRKGMTPIALALQGNHLDIAKMISEEMSNFIDTVEKNKPGSQSENESKCVICFESKDGTYAFLPCGHACACKNCCEIIKGDPNKNCPICRGNVVQYQKIFISHH